MFLDTNIFIHAYGITDYKGRACDRLLYRIAGGEQKAATSVMVVDEVLFFFSEKDGMTRAAEIWEDLSQTPNLEILGVDARMIGQAVRYMTDGLQATDAFHIAAMKANGIEVICSYDKGFDKIKDIRRQEPK